MILPAWLTVDVLSFTVRWLDRVALKFELGQNITVSPLLSSLEFPEQLHGFQKPHQISIKTDV